MEMQGCPPQCQPLRKYGLNKALLGDDGNPLEIRPSFFGGYVALGGWWVPLDSHDSTSKGSQTSKFVEKGRGKLPTRKGRHWQQALLLLAEMPEKKLLPSTISFLVK